ncbi:MAG: ubiquitin-like domain-containing protein, partial [Anaerolineae bacterium]
MSDRVFPAHALETGAVAVRPQTVLARLAVVLLMAGLVWRFVATLAPVTVQVDGYADRVFTHQRTVRELLAELNLALAPGDHMTPALEQAIAPGLHVQVTRARPLLVVADGREILVRTHSQRVGDIWPAAGITPAGMDERFLDGVPVTDQTALPVPVIEPGVAPRYRAGRPWVG